MYDNGAMKKIKKNHHLNQSWYHFTWADDVKYKRYTNISSQAKSSDYEYEFQQGN